MRCMDTRSKLPGIVFGSNNMPNSYLNSVHTGWMQGGPLSPENIISQLSGARAKGGRVVVKLCKGRDEYVKNSDGTFSLTKWKALVDRYKKVNLGPYIADGTIIGHYLIDEPHRASRWGGKAISPATLEAMAKHSKQLAHHDDDRPGGAELVGELLPQLHVSGRRLDPVHLGQGGRREVGGLRGRRRQAQGARPGRRTERARRRERVEQDRRVDQGQVGHERQRAAQLRWGHARPEPCLRFFNWTHDVQYYGRSDIKSAMADLSAKARAHAKTSCRQ